jgi:hypothetical protein
LILLQLERDGIGASPCRVPSKDLPGVRIGGAPIDVVAKKIICRHPTPIAGLQIDAKPRHSWQSATSHGALGMRS